MCMRSKKLEPSMTKIECTTVLKAMERGWSQLKLIALKHSTQNIETKINNIPNKKPRSLAATTPKKKQAVASPPLPPPETPQRSRHQQPDPAKKKKVAMYCAKCNNTNFNSSTFKFHLV